jgi:guanylate kinase
MGKFILVLGPTGSGKSVLIAYIKETFPEITYPHTYTTRPKRPVAENPAYQFLSVEEFEAKKDAGEFLEWARFGENYYSTSKTEVLDALTQGKVLLKEMELQGVRQTLEILPREQLVTIYIDAGSWEELERRVRARAPIGEEELAKRKQRYEDEVTFQGTADYVVQNLPGKLEDAKEAIKKIILGILAA